MLVENACDTEVKETNGVFRSSKRKGNGVGIQSVRHIAEKNGGGTVKSESTRFPDAIEWLNNNIREHDSLGHNYTIMDIVPA